MSSGAGLSWRRGINGIRDEGSMAALYIVLLLERSSPFLEPPVVIVHLRVLWDWGGWKIYS